VTPDARRADVENPVGCRGKATVAHFAGRVTTRNLCRCAGTGAWRWALLNRRTKRRANKISPTEPTRRIDDRKTLWGDDVEY
jgi:hypothetical protein